MTMPVGALTSMPVFECPLCRKTISVERVEEARFRPFCSERCKMVDLGRWLDGTYSISEPLPSPTEEPADLSQSDER